MENTGSYYDDEGNKFNPDIISKPDLCVSCKKDGLNAEQGILCNLTRADQHGKDEFICDSYEPKDK
ncbi:MAG: hypothetical protein ACYSSI_03590 [Planctomycetota bacterium]|jgi:hypothetical protein